MALSSFLYGLAKFAANILFEESISSVVTLLFPKQTLLAASILGHTYSITTSEVASALVSHGLSNLIDSQSELPTVITEYNESYANIEFEGRGSSEQILESNGILRGLDFEVPKPYGIHLPQFAPSLKFSSFSTPSFPKPGYSQFPSFRPPQWNPITRRWE